MRFANTEQSSKLFCTTCDLNTFHSSIAFHRRYLFYPEDLPKNSASYISTDSYESLENQRGIFVNDCDEVTEYRLFVCDGCKSAQLVEAHTFKTAYDFYYEEKSTDTLPNEERKSVMWQIGYWRETDTARESKTYKKLGAKLNRIYGEIISSYNAGNRLLNAVGLRALLEGICEDQGITDNDASNLAKKLDALSSRGIVPSNIVTHLHKYRLMGNVAAHNLEAPSRDVLSLYINIIEDLLNFIYDLEYKLSSLPSHNKGSLQSARDTRSVGG